MARLDVGEVFVIGRVDAHQAIRRLRSTLRSFGKICNCDDTQRLAAELRWPGTVPGQVRDGEVLVGHSLDWTRLRGNL